jgi:hypothetical protein
MKKVEYRKLTDKEFSEAIKNGFNQYFIFDVKIKKNGLIGEFDGFKIYKPGKSIFNNARIKSKN